MGERNDRGFDRFNKSRSVQLGLIRLSIFFYFFYQGLRKSLYRDYSNDHAVVCGLRNDLFSRSFGVELRLISGKRLVALIKCLPMEPALLVPSETYAPGPLRASVLSSQLNDRPTFLDSGSFYRRSPECHKWPRTKSRCERRSGVIVNASSSDLLGPVRQTLKAGAGLVCLFTERRR